MSKTRSIYRSTDAIVAAGIAAQTGMTGIAKASIILLIGGDIT